jgi:hypothetical protein
MYIFFGRTFQEQEQDQEQEQEQEHYFRVN